MNSFNYQYFVRQHFGKGCIEDAIKEKMKRAGKDVVDFSGIMPNPTYVKVQEGARIVRDEHVDFILTMVGSVIDWCMIVSSQAKMDMNVWDDWYVSHNLPKEFVPQSAVVKESGIGAEGITYKDADVAELRVIAEKGIGRPGNFYQRDRLVHILWRKRPYRQMSVIRAIDLGDAGRTFNISYGNWNFGTFQDYTYDHTYMPSAIESVLTNTNNRDYHIYTLDGKQVSNPQKGLNITRLSDRTTKKILMK